jgi:glycosyltransferase involved in cell wall biosynthesis
MTSTLPLVSVVIPTRNRLALLQRAIGSVEAQTYPNVEIVVVDNHADDPLTHDQIRTSRPITIARTPTKLLLPLSRNFGADHASGEFISFLDDDDEILPSKIASHVASFLRDPELSFVYGNTRHIGPDGETLVVAGGPPELVPFLRWRYIHTNALIPLSGMIDSCCPEGILTEART